MSAYVHAPHDAASHAPAKKAKKAKKPAPATPVQRHWIELVLADPTRIMTDGQRTATASALADPALSKKDAGLLLDLLFALPRVDTGVPDGLYRDHEGTLYVVTPSKSGTSHYALVLRYGRLDYEKGARNALTPDMRLSDETQVPELSAFKASTYVGKKLRAALAA